MKQNDWTDKLRGRMADMEAGVPDDLWNRIEARLDEAQADEAVPGQPVASGVARRPRVARMVSWALSAAAVVAVLVVVGLRMNEDGIRQVARVERDAARHHYRDVWPTYDGGLLVAKAAPENAASGASQGRQADACRNVAAGVGDASAAGADSVAPTRCETPANDLEQVAPVSSAVSTSKDGKDGASHSKQPAQGACSTRRPDVANVHRMYGDERSAGARRRGRWHVGVYADGVTIGSQNSQHPMVMVANYNQTYTSPTPGKPMSDYSEPGCSGIYASLNSKYSEKKHHSRPVSVGLTVDVPLTRRLSVVTGAVYTSAATDFMSSVGKSEVQEKQRLHYVGVPLGAKLEVWSIGGLHTYATAYGQADFNVAARLSSGGISKDIKKDRPQFSVGAAAGVQYNIVNSLGMYVEPGVRYYIDNGSGMETIFKDKQVNFSLQLGLRYGF